MGAECYLAGKTSSEFQARLASDVTGQVRLATLINRVMVQSWGQGAMMAAARLAPRLISDIADLTAHTRSKLIGGSDWYSAFACGPNVN
jgi:hypothetical protein